MASFEFRLPDIGEGIAEAEVVAWHVSPGQQVAENQDMVEVMTDKATVTIGAPRKGRVAKLNAAVGERVKVGSVLVVIDPLESDLPRSAEADEHAGAREQNGEPRAAAREQSREPRPSRFPPAPDADTARSRFQAPASRTPFPAPGAARGRERALRPVRAGQELARSAGAADLDPRAPAREQAEAPRAGQDPNGAVLASAVGDIREDLPGASFFTRAARAPALGEAQPGSAQRPLATPATRKLARDLGVDLRGISPSGPHGRVTKDDVLGAPAAGRAQAPAREERRPFVGMRRRIAERMQLAKHKAAHFTFVEEVEVDRLQDVIARLREPAERAQVKLHYLPFIVKAATLALKKHPILNSMLDEAKSELVYRRYYHIGVATATEQGLVVPVVRDADQKSVLSIAADIQRLAEAARLGKLSAAELSGSTFTVTSLGKHGGLLATPVLNHPEVGILGVHRVKQRPVVRNGEIVVGQVMYLSLSLDHRIVDGHVGAAFAYDLIAYLEDPELLLLELA